MLDTLARPVPAENAMRDPRTPGQRRHDALLDWLQLVERARLLPDTAGTTTTLVLTMDAAALTSGTGTARTGHGHPVPADVARQWAGRDARVIAVLLDKAKAITAYSSTHRLFTEQQRLALHVRDRGCSFPRCDAQPGYTPRSTTSTNTAMAARPPSPTAPSSAGVITATSKLRAGVAPCLTASRTGSRRSGSTPDQTPIRNRMHDY
jgi:hypothetical protein